MSNLTILPSQDWDHMFGCVSGSSGIGMYDLQFAAKPEASATIHRGSLVSLNADGEFVAGLGSATAMPMWAINASYDLDVGGGSSFEVGNLTSFGGKVGAYVGTGGYELITTEYDDAGTYAPNTQLMASAGTAGYVTEFSGLNTAVAVVGVVSKGVETLKSLAKSTADTGTAGSGIATRPAAAGAQVLRFWPCYVPAVTIA